MPAWKKLSPSAPLQLLAIALLLSIGAAALHDVSSAWDNWYYHLPFAARLAGIVPPEAYVFHPLNQARLAGYPLLGELLQGLLWRLTGHLQAANLVAFAAVPLHAWYLRRTFRVPFHLTVLALLAIPLVQLHAGACYVDLPANVCASILVLAVHRLYTRSDPPSDGDLLVLAASAAGAANMRFQLHPLILVAFLAAAPRVLRPLLTAARGPAPSPARRRLALIALVLPLIFFTPLRNLLLHHNPYYPIELVAPGLTLDGPEGAYAASPRYLENAPRAQRWLYSLLEIGVRPLSETRRWTIDQWAPPDSPATRMGGFFGAYVVFQLAVLAWQLARGSSREARVAGLFFAALSVLRAFSPQSHELRYYLDWMIVLCSLNLILLCRERTPASIPLRPPLFGACCALALGVVLAVTRAGYVYPSGSTFREALRDQVDPKVLEQIHEGEQICLSREPWTFLYAPTFHPEKRYSVREVESRDQCGEARFIE
ncbi:MAG: hypothetical protein ABI193_25860 [Minicystis sp.]